MLDADSVSFIREKCWTLADYCTRQKQIKRRGGFLTEEMDSECEMNKIKNKLLVDRKSERKTFDQGVEISGHISDIGIGFENK